MCFLTYILNFPVTPRTLLNGIALTVPLKKKMATRICVLTVCLRLGHLCTWNDPHSLQEQAQMAEIYKVLERYSPILDASI